MIHSPTTHPDAIPVSSATHRQQLAAGGCFATLMLIALGASWLLSQPLLQKEVLRQALQDTVTERDQLQQQLDERGGTSGTSGGGVQSAPTALQPGPPIRIRLDRNAGTPSVVLHLDPPAPVALGNLIVPRAAQLVLHLQADQSVVGWIDEHNDFGSDYSTVRRVLQWPAGEAPTMRVVTSADDANWIAVQSLIGDPATAPPWIDAHQPLRLQLGERTIRVGESNTDAALPLLIVPSG